MMDGLIVVLALYGLSLEVYLLFAGIASRLDFFVNYRRRHEDSTRNCCI